MSTINRTNQQTAEQKLAVGLQKHAADLPALVLDGTPYKAAEAITIVQGLINSAQLVVSTRAAWQASIVADQDERAKRKAFMAGLVAAIRAAYSGSITDLSDFGLAPRKTPAVRTPEQKAAAAAKAKATRTARHTMGKKQKAQITGATAASQPPGDATKVPAPAQTPAPTPTPAPAPATTAAPAPAPIPATPHA